MSAFIEALNAASERCLAYGAAMVMQTFLLFALLLALDFMLRRRVRAALRHAFWLLFLIKLVLPPSWSFPTGAGYWLGGQTWAPASSPAVPRPSASAEVISITRAPVSVSPAARSQPSLRPAAWLGLAWLVGAIGLFACFIGRVVQLRRVVARSVPAPDAVQVLLDGCRVQLGLRVAVRVLLSGDVRSPALCGLRRPVVLLPLADALGTARWRAVLFHELIHVQRGDLWLQTFQALLQIAYWWHPLVWAANHRIRIAREEAVDDRVMRELGSEAELYPATLVELAKGALPLRWAGLSLLGILDLGGGLARRIRRLIETAPPVRPRLGWSGALWTVLLGALVIPMRAQVRTHPSMPNEPDPAVTATLTALDTRVLDALPPQAVLQRSGFAERPEVVGVWMQSGRAIMGRKQTARELLAIAYESRPSRVTSSKRLPEGLFDFIVSGDEPPLVVLRSLLRDRLGLSAKRTPAKMAVLMLVQKPGATLPASKSVSNESLVSYETDRVLFEAATLGTLGSFLEHHLDQPVIEETQDTRRYDFVLSWVRDATPAARAALKQAVREQFGMTLTSAQRETDAVLVDSKAQEQGGRAAADPGATVVAAVYDALYDPQRGARQPKPILGQAEVEAVVGPADGSKPLLLDQAVQILRAAGYVPGSIIGLDQWFVETYGKKGGQTIENASLVMAGRSNSLHGVVDFYEPPAVDRERRDELSPFAHERERLRELRNRFTPEHPQVVQQRQRLAELEARFRNRAFRVDPQLFLRNLGLRRGETIRAASDDPMEIFLDLLKGAGVDCAAPNQQFFNRETGTIVMWNTAEGLAAAERVILGLNQPDGRPSSYAPPAGTNPSILAEATVLQVTEAAFTRLLLTEPSRAAQQVGDFWHLDPEDWQTIKNRTRAEGMPILTRPRIRTSPGVTARLFVGRSPSNAAPESVSVELVPYLTGEQMELTVLVQTTGHFSPGRPVDWPDQEGWTNLALHGRVTLKEGEGVVMRARHTGPNPTNNLVVLLTARVVPQ